ncbi:T9SS type A sorting domain-containing protein [Taibaiella soli]|uniref:Secretion system C-terminal sorting domain-containing protein n=1 Tax=Taibaiella soli TaxID=1649169 RepID=A0A2W2AH37_9BACT|nr:T9SS type A sorting domain-containing protein [Taibaiella soli]PZF71530.1 hypothetical protein DN068_17980 [Taibaiella soli]
MKHLFKRMLTIASLCASVLQTQAQDTYWSMAGNRVYNVKTNSLTTISSTGIPLDYSNPNPRAIFSAAGSVLFSSSMSSIDFAGVWTNMTGEGARVIIPLTGPSNCNQYAIINTRGVTVPHGSALDVTIMDVSGVTNNINTTNFPNAVSSANISVGDPLYYDAVAAPAQSNGDHYYYFISANNGPGQPGPYIEQYTLHSDGTRPTLANSYGTTANYRQYDSYTSHYIASKAKISNDGAYIAYQDINGNLITFNTATQAYAVGPNLSTIYGLEGVNIGGTVRWYVSTATQFGYFTQGSTTFNVLTPNYGIKSDVALGANGLMFIARGTTFGGNAADLMSFDPNSGFSPVTRQLGCVYNNGTSYSFGNQLTGENTSEFAAIHTDFTVNGDRGTLANPKAVYTCQSIRLTDLTTPAQTYLNMGIVQVDASGNPVAGGLTWGYSFLRPFGGLVDLKNLPGSNSTWLATPGHEGYYRIDMMNNDACGRASNVTEYIKLETPATPVVTTFNVNGITQTTAGVYPVINLCAPATALNLGATLGGVYTSYDVTVTRLSGTPPSFVYGTSATYTVPLGSFTGFDIASNATLASVVAGYAGYLSVKITNHGICGDGLKEEIFQLTRSSSVAGLDFTLNSVSQSGSTAADVNECDGGTALKVAASVTSGTLVDYTIDVTPGTYTGGVFTATGSTVSALHVLQTGMPYDISSLSGMLGYTGTIQVSVTANSTCTGQNVKHYYNIHAVNTPTVVTFDVNGVTPTGPTNYPNVVLCDGATALNLDATLTANYTSYVVTVTQLGATLPLTYGTNAAATFASSSYSSFDMASNAALSPVIGSYSGYVSVKVKAIGVCGNNEKEEIFHLVRATSLSGLDFKLDSVAQVYVDTPGKVWLCNGDSALKLQPWVTGTVDSYRIEASTGSYSGTTFTAGTTYTEYNVLPASMPYDLAANIAALNHYYGYLQIKLTVYGPCGGPLTTTHIFSVNSASALVDFGMQAPPQANCPGGGYQARNTSPTFNPHGQVSAPFCDQGWLGAASCAMIGVAANVVNTSATLYIVKLDGPGGQIASQTFTGTLPTALAFASLASGYFINNYAAIKGTDVFKVSASIVTTVCDTVTTSSYFKIIDGGPQYSAGNYWKETLDNAQVMEANVFPNPATNQIQVAWHAQSGATEATLMMVDVLGKVVIKKQLPQIEGFNDVSLDVSMLVPGTYHYKLSTANGEKTGTLVKE